MWYVYAVRGVAQHGSALALGARSRWFKSSRPDHSSLVRWTIDDRPASCGTETIALCVRWDAKVFITQSSFINHHLPSSSRNELKLT